MNTLVFVLIYIIIAQLLIICFFIYDKIRITKKINKIYNNFNKLIKSFYTRGYKEFKPFIVKDK